MCTRYLRSCLPRSAVSGVRGRDGSNGRPLVRIMPLVPGRVWGCGGRAVPGSGRSVLARHPGWSCDAACSPDLTCAGWLGWAHYRPPGLRGRPFPAGGHACSGRARRCRVPRNRWWCRPSIPGSSWQAMARPTQTGSLRPPDQRKRDMNRAVAVHVTLGRIMPRGSWDGRGRNGTTAGCVAPGRSGLVDERACPWSGTAVHVTPGDGSAPNPATPHRRRGRGEPGRHHDSPGPVGDAGWPEPGTARPRDRPVPSSTPARSAERAGISGSARTRRDPAVLAPTCRSQARQREAAGGRRPCTDTTIYTWRTSRVQGDRDRSHGTRGSA
jgi:hypothetical protein